MTLKTKRYTTALLTLVAVFSLVGYAVADNNQQKLDNIQQQMQQQQDKINKAQDKYENVSGQLQKIQAALEFAVDEYNKVQEQLTATEQLIKSNEAVLKNAEKNLAERGKILNKRARDIYKNGQLSYIDVIFGATDFADFISRMDILQRIVRYDIELIGRIKIEKETILHKKEELTQQRATILTLKQAAEEKKNLITAKKQEQEKFLSQIVNERDTAGQALKELQEASREIENMLRGYQGGTPTGTGTMLWPIRGEITSPFGYRIHPIFGTRIYHSGIDIGADTGDPVRAADSGEVVTASWYGGYGYAVIINHGGGIASLYGHNSELLVTVGQNVAKGQVIAHAGLTGWSTGPHVHFEVRQNGTPVNPLNFLP